MFLSSLVRDNPEFIEAAAELHRRGEIPASSYVLDIDRIESNTRAFVEAAHRLGLEVLPMTKQIGRAKAAMDAMVRGGADGFVAVDMEGARAIKDAGHRLGHVGHLVQVPRHQAAEAGGMRPGLWTVYSLDKAREVDEAAARLGYVQDVLARIHAPGDIFYAGHEGGFAADEVVQVAEGLAALPNLRFVGITTFPALLFNEARSVEATPNLATLDRVRAELEAAGYRDLVVNAPGTTSTAVLETLASAGATQIEPGHGLTATTPLHAVRDDLPEIPAVCHLSEVSHFHEGRSYFFGGGLYIDPVFPDYQVTALVGNGPLVGTDPVPAHLPPPSMIDYYGQLDPEGREIRTGDTVILGFRVQAFFTRAFVVAVSGVATGVPTVDGIWTGDGRPVTVGGHP